MYNHQRAERPFSASFAGTFIPQEDIECRLPEVANFAESNPKDNSHTLSGSCDPFTDIQEVTLPTSARSRISWLPPLAFQLPQKPRSALTSSSTMPSLDTPTRPLLICSATSSPSIASSSFYSGSTSPSSFSVTRQPSAMSSASEHSRCRPLQDSPRRIMMTSSKPDVPPIPWKWRRTTPGLHKTARPGRPGSRPILPPAGFWEYASEQQKSGFPALRGSTSWTDMTDSTKREPSMCRYPILPTTPPKSLTPDKSRIARGQLGRRRSYESLRKGEGRREPTPPRLNTRWLDLDDRRDPRSKKRTAQRRESRTLVKKRQP